MSDQPKPPAIQGQRVGLRPVVQSDIAVLDAWVNDLAIQGGYNMFGLEPEMARWPASRHAACSTMIMGR